MQLVSITSKYVISKQTNEKLNRNNTMIPLNTAAA